MKPQAVDVSTTYAESCEPELHANAKLNVEHIAIVIIAIFQKEKLGLITRVRRVNMHIMHVQHTDADDKSLHTENKSGYRPLNKYPVHNHTANSRHANACSDLLNFKTNCALGDDFSIMQVR